MMKAGVVYPQTELGGDTGAVTPGVIGTLGTLGSASISDSEANYTGFIGDPAALSGYRRGLVRAQSKVTRASPMTAASSVHRKT